jgi:hypothetical protein
VRAAGGLVRLGRPAEAAVLLKVPNVCG